MFPQIVLHDMCAYRLAKAVVDGKAPILGFVLLHKHGYNGEDSKVS